MESRPDAGPRPVTHPDFGSYATLKCGIEYERQRIAWLRWVIGEFTSQQPAASSQQPAEENTHRGGMVSIK